MHADVEMLLNTFDANTHNVCYLNITEKSLIGLTIMLVCHILMLGVCRCTCEWGADRECVCC